MDKFKKFLTALKKYQFWVITGAVLIATIVCWWLATAGLAGQFKQRETKLEGEFKGVIISKNHPNQGVIDKIGQQHEALKRSVYDAWEVLYREQKEKNPFPKVLGEDFKRQFENLKPKEELRPEYRELYQNFIMGHFPTLLKMIDVRRPAEEKETATGGNARTAPAKLPGGNAAVGRRGREGSGRSSPKPARVPDLGGGGAMRTMGPGHENAAADEWIGTVDWNDSDYRALEERFEWQETPSTLAVVLAQEDLWVYEALLRIIKNTNEGATSYATAAVKRIDALEIGSDAAKAWKAAEDAIFHVAQAGPIAAAGVAEGMGPTTGPSGLGGPSGPGGRMRPGMDMPGGFGGPGGAAGLSAEEQSRRQLIESRYVDDKGKPLSYESEYPYAKHPYAEFKMMPIRMNLVMDQRRLPKLLAECANSNMPIQVRRIRILKTQGAAISLASASPGTGAGTGAGPSMGTGLGAGMSAGAGMMGARPHSAEGMGRPGIGGGSSAARQMGGEKEDAGPFDIPVEVHGVIYIYNPPNLQKVGTGAASGEKSTESAAAAAPSTPAPAAAPVPPPAAAPAAPAKKPAASPERPSKP